MAKIQFKLNNRVVTAGTVNAVNPVSFIFKLGRAAFILLLVLLPLSFLSSTTVYNEDLAFGFFSAAVLFGIGCFICLVLYKGKQVLLDPPSFVNVLIFALLVISPTVLSTPSTAANTFGVVGLRSISGLAVILFVIAFYLINLFNLGDRIWTLFPKIASIVNIVILFSILVSGIYTKTGFVNTITLLVLLSIINFVISLKLNNDRVTALNSVVLTLTYLFTYKIVNPEFKIVVSVLLGAVFYFLILRVVKRIGAQNIKDEFLSNRRFALYALGLALSLVSLLLTVLTSGVNSFSSITKLVNYYTNFGALESNVVGQILFGRGLLNSAASGNSTLYVIISSFGLMALVGFLYLFFYVLIREIRAKRVLNTLVLLLIAAGSLFVNLGTYTSIVFLFILIQTAVAEPFILRPSVNTNNVYLRQGRRIALVAVLVLTVVVVVNLLKLLKILV
jgi:hypothetical protein